MYEYKAELDRVVDGDTLDCIVDIGFSVFVKKRVRLYGIDTFESRTRDMEEKKKGLAAKARLIELIKENGNQFILISHELGKYGRILGEIILKTSHNQEGREGGFNYHLVTSDVLNFEKSSTYFEFISYMNIRLY